MHIEWQCRIQNDWFHWSGSQKKKSRMELNNSSTFQGFYAVFKAHTKFKHFSRQGLKFKHFSRCCAPWHTIRIDSYQIPSENKTKSKLQIWKICQNSNFRILYSTHLLKLLDKMCKYEMDPASIVEDKERHDYVHRQTDRRETSIPPFQLRWSRGYNNDS